MSMRFHEGLLLFVFLYFLAYITLDIFEKKINNLNIKVSLPLTKNFNVFSTLIFAILSIVTFATINIEKDFKASVSYQIMVVVLLALYLLILLRTSPFAKILGLVFVMSIIYLSHMTPTPVFYERSKALYILSLKGHWDVAQPLVNPFYNPLPMDLALALFLHEVLGLDIIEGSGLVLIIFNTILALSLVIALFAYLKGCGTNGLIAYVSILLFIFTPPLNPTGHGPKYLSALSSFLSVFVLNKALRVGIIRMSELILLIILIFHSVFTHGSGFILLFLSLTMLAFSSAIMKLKKTEKEIEKVCRIQVIRIFALVTLFAVVFKVIYTFGVITIIKQGIPSIQALLDAIFNLGMEKPRTVHRSLYYHFVEWYYASSWALIPGVSVYYALRKSVKLVRESGENFSTSFMLWVAGALTLGLGLLFYLSGGSYATVYPAYFFLIPFIAEELRKRKTAQVLLAMLILTISPLASMDPSLNPIIYDKINPMNNPAATLSDYIEGKIVVLHIERSPNFEYWFLEYRIGSVVATLSEKYKLASAPAYVGNVRVWQLYEELQFNCSVEPKILYVFRSELLACTHNKEGINIVYSSIRTEILWKD